MTDEINPPQDKMSAEKPILFSGPMVKAILAGTKTQTRRAVKPQPGTGAVITARSSGGFVLEKWARCAREMGNYGRCEDVDCPYSVGRLWVDKG